MRTGDSRSKGGPGILPLQAIYQKWEIDKRPSVLAYRLLKRLDGIDELGHFVYEDTSVGDIHGGQLLYNATRPCPMWRFATPVVTAKPEGKASATKGQKYQAGLDVGLLFPQQGPDVATGGGKETCKVLSGKRTLIPIFGDFYEPDKRMETLTVTEPDRSGKPMWPKFPLDYIGISLIGDVETRQVNLFHPTDPRIIAVNREGDAKMGSLVCDMAPEFKIDLDRMARTQSFWRVIKRPRGCKFLNFSNENSIAWNIDESGCGDVRGGIVCEKDRSGPSDTQEGGERIIIGMVSQVASGPWDLGGRVCQHEIGQDADGNPIRPVHISTNAYFKRSFEDGPLEFSTFRQGKDYDEPAIVRLGFDGNPAHQFVCGEKKGMWKWWTTVPQRLFDPPGIPTGEPTFVSAITVPGSPQRFLTTSADSAFTAIVGRPQMIARTVVDARKSKKLSEKIKADLEKKTPMVSRIEAWGRQRNTEWIRTESAPSSRWPGGTAPGGFLVMPPEQDMADDLLSWTMPNIRTTSATYFSVLTGSYFGAGLPDLTTGAMKTAYRWGVNSSGVLSFDQINSSGTATANVLALDNNARVGINTASPATTFHVATSSVRMDLTNDALAGGGTATLGGVGGSGPTRTGQDSWIRWNFNGTTYWIPVWT